MPFFLGWGVEWGKNINMKFYHYIVILKGVLSGHFVIYFYFYFFLCVLVYNRVTHKEIQNFQALSQGDVLNNTSFFFGKCLQNWFLLECERETNAKSSKFVVKLKFYYLVSSIMGKDSLKKLLDYISPISNCGHCFSQRKPLSEGQQ